jgi:hypothetical protein
MTYPVLRVRQRTRRRREYPNATLDDLARIVGHRCETIVRLDAVEAPLLLVVNQRELIERAASELIARAIENAERRAM